MSEVLKQSAVIPVRLTKGNLEVLLVTSRDTGRWVLPKGNVKSSLSSVQSAEQEAYEEAGVKGTVAETKVGKYKYVKPEGPHVYEVELFVLKVEKELKDWKEKHQRTRKWFSALEAAELVVEKKLAKILKKSRLQTIAALI